MEIHLSKTQINYARLQEAPSLFDEGMQGKPIYHYTSIGGLQEVLKNKKLWFTNVHYMNDKDEIVAGLEGMAKALEMDENERKGIQSSFLNQDVQTFVCCFSLAADSLPMWNYYSKEINSQGYNIEFDAYKLVESILRSNPLLDGCDFAFGNVDYSKDNDSQYSQKYADKMISSLQIAAGKVLLTLIKGRATKSSESDESPTKRFEKWIEEAENNQKLVNMQVYFYNGESCRFDRDNRENHLYFIKRDYFAHEQEFRIAITVPRSLLPRLRETGIYNFRISNGVLIPYIELAFSEDVVKSITISPTIYNDLIELSIQDFMKYCGYDITNFAEIIKHSKIPVRF